MHRKCGMKLRKRLQSLCVDLSLSSKMKVMGGPINHFLAFPFLRSELVVVVVVVVVIWPSPASFLKNLT